MKILFSAVWLLVSTFQCHSLAEPTFRESQLNYSRVLNAAESQQNRLEKTFKQKNIAYPPARIFFRVFKKEKQLELWATEFDTEPFQLIKTYPICKSSGHLGPKRKSGDLQVPEGFYFVSDFNPESQYHLSLRLNYPNSLDRLVGEPENLGGDIFVHGGCETVGCLPMTDTAMEEIYLTVLDVVSAHHNLIPIHIFPTHLEGKDWEYLEQMYGHRAELMNFWQNLREGYQLFEKDRKVPIVEVAKPGKYLFISDHDKDP